ncbi:MAG: radical SAM protein [Alphaproteobacteria bacterium]|jgi:MoaA/NifB/PqqE/SkfB family radical SAM enzyme|nr:radical SAM protein [Alphaproteobacteria bacterium]
MPETAAREAEIRPPTDFGEQEFPTALVNVTNVCNLDCSHCFVFRASNPNRPRDKMDDATMLHQLRVLRDKHGIRSMLFMGGEPMIRKKMVMQAAELFELPAIVTNGTYGIPRLPGGLVTVSLDGPEALSDSIRGEGVFQKVKAAIAEREPNDETTVIVQMTITRQNEAGIEAFVEEVKDWPINGVAFTFYVPVVEDDTRLGWDDLAERDAVIDRVIAVKRKYPSVVKANVGALELMYSDRCLEYTGAAGEHCMMRATLPLYMGEGGNFERPFCCYGNDVDCSKCGAYSVFNTAHHRLTLGQDDYHHRTRHIADQGPRLNGPLPD